MEFIENEFLYKRTLFIKRDSLPVDLAYNYLFIKNMKPNQFNKNIDLINKTQLELEKSGHYLLSRNLSLIITKKLLSNEKINVHYFKHISKYYDLSLKSNNFSSLSIYCDFSQSLNYLGLDELNEKYLETLSKHSYQKLFSHSLNFKNNLNKLIIMRLPFQSDNTSLKYIDYNHLTLYYYFNLKLINNTFDFNEFLNKNESLEQNEIEDILYFYAYNEIKNCLTQKKAISPNIKKIINNLNISDEYLLPLKMIVYNDYKSFLSLKNIYLSKFEKDYNSYFDNSLTYNNDLALYYILSKRKNILEEYLDISSYKPHFKKNIIPILFKNTEYKKMFRSKTELYRKIDKDSILDPFFTIAKIFSREGEIKKTIVHDYDKENNTLKKLRKTIKSNSTILLFLKAFSIEKTFIIKQNKTIEMDFNNQLDFIQKLEKTDNFYISDNSNLLKNRFEEYFIKYHKIIPNVIYFDYLSEFNNDTLVTSITNATYYGMNKPFHFKNKTYSKLYYIHKEGKYFNDIFNGNSQINSSGTLNFNNDIVHLSGHFIKSRYHPIYNKIAFGFKDSTMTYFAGYDTYAKQINSKLVFINACESGQSKTYDPISGARNFAEFLMDAGAKSVIVNNVDVDDYCASQFSRIFYLHLSRGVDAITSLAVAKQYMFENISKDPKVWNAAKLYGNNLLIRTEDISISTYVFSSFMLLVLSLFIILLKLKNNKKLIN